MADLMSKHAFGKKEGIETAKQAGKLDEFDILFLDTGETGWIDKNGNTVIATARTQKPITINGATCFDMADGDTIPAGKSFEDIVKMLAQKSIPVEYTAPTIKLINNEGTVSGDIEAGTEITPKLSATFVKNDAGNLTKLAITMDNVEVGTGTESNYTYTGNSVVIGDETISFKVTATYDEGQVKADNLGEASPDGHIEAGTITSEPYTFKGKRKIFYGFGTEPLGTVTSELIRGLADSKLEVQSGEKITVTADKGCRYIAFAAPTSVKLSQISYDDMGDNSMLNSFEKETVQVADARGGANGLKDYACYSYKLKVPATVPLTFTFTIE